MLSESIKSPFTGFFYAPKLPKQPRNALGKKLARYILVYLVLIDTLLIISKLQEDFFHGKTSSYATLKRKRSESVKEHLIFHGKNSIFITNIKFTYNATQCT